MMKKITGILILLAIMLAGCRNNNSGNTSEAIFPEEEKRNSTLDYVQEYEALSSILQQFEEPAQVFRVTSTEHSQVIGRQGTVINLNPDYLETVDGEPVTGEITVVLKEQTNQRELVLGNTQTVSNGQLIVSGGAYYIGMAADGKELRIKKGKSLDMEFPKVTEDEMELFYGQRDSLGQMNWQVAQQKFVKKKHKEEDFIAETDVFMVVLETIEGIDTIKNFSQKEFEKQQKRRKMEKETREVEEKLYEAIKINQLGWINCDRFYRIPPDCKTDLIIAMDNKLIDVPVAKAFLVFKNINSVLSYNYFAHEDDNHFNNIHFNNIPVGEDVKLIIYTAEKGKVYIHSSDFTLKKDETLTIALKESNDKELENMLMLH